MCSWVCLVGGAAVRSGLGLWVLGLGLVFLVTFNAATGNGAADGEGEVTTPTREEKRQVSTNCDSVVSVWMVQSRGVQSVARLERFCEVHDCN